MLDEEMIEASAEDLRQAAERLSLVLVGQPVRSFFSLASKAGRDGAEYWLRVRRVRLLKWVPARCLGYEQSSIIEGVPKPVVVGHTEWWAAPYIVRAEMLSYVAEPVLGSGLHLRENPNLPDSWWWGLQSALKNLAQTPTRRDTANVLGDAVWLRKFYGADIPDPTEWAVEHEDPHWANITGPELHILDWDFWGLQPRGFTVAGLYCTSLGVPEVSDRVWNEFADVLDTPTGQWCVLYHLWHRRRGLPSFAAWERGAGKVREIITSVTRP